MAEKHNNGPNRRNDYGSSNRRKFLIGAGSVAAGGSALLGTAATTTFNLNDRGVSANVVTDSTAAVALTDTENPGDIINYTSDELEIDFSEFGGNEGAQGVNVGSVVTVGDFNGLSNTSSNDAAFTITNQTTDTVDLKVEFVAGENYNAVSGGSSLKFKFAEEGGTTEKILPIDESNGVATTGNSNSLTFSDGTNPTELGDGGVLDVAIEVDADNTNSAITENLSGVLNITATQG